MRPVSRTQIKKVYFIGIGGIGMSALARWFKSQKWAVFGSDSAGGSWIRELQKDGLYVKIGHKKGHINPKIGLVIYNQAIPKANPELREAKRLGIPTLSYPEMLGALTRHYTTFAVAGAHGKSTTTSLLSLVLAKAGLDPTVIVGTKLKEFGNRNFRAGKSKNLVIEADEFKGAFWHYSPTYAIVTNIDREHLDFYKNLSNVKKSFLKFIGNIQTGGILIVNKDNENLLALNRQIQKIAKRKKFKVIWYSVMMRHNTCRQIKNVLKVPGAHNVSNALAVYTLARELGINEKTILRALGDYHGAWRRFEYRGTLNVKGQKLDVRCPVFDDYAHHPTEIKATLQAFREKYPNHHLICVFQPHQAKRLKVLFKDFINAFDDADYLILLPVYQVAGRDKVDSRFTSELLARKIAFRNSKLGIRNSVKHIPYSIYLSNPQKLSEIIKKIIRNHSRHSHKFVDSHYVLVMMGAGDIVNFTNNLI
jgi:UDP-N-acetylmuramate--alanine ligase